MADLKDSGRLAIGLGLGLSADAKLGDLTHPSIGILASAAMVGFESRDIDGAWYEAQVSDPFSTYWYRRDGRSWGSAFLLSGWRGAWESLGWLDAIDELDEPFDQEGLPETGTMFGGEMLDGRLIASRWLPMGSAPEGFPALWEFHSATDLQLGVHLLLINARVGFNPLEFADFLGGFFGYDLAGDDPEPE